MDLNGDGYIDILSGSWPGELFLFRGGPDRTFEPPEMLKDKDGKIINIGGGKRENGDMLLIAGSAQFEETPEGRFVTYQGEKLESTTDRPIGITGTASAAHAADWDGDGDLDIFVGDIGGNVYLIPNEGDARNYAFGKEVHVQAGGRPLRVEGDAGPFVVDWNGDGSLDLLVGSGDGSVMFCRNVGTASAPELATGVNLVEPGYASFGGEFPKEPTRGARSKVCAADWNGDGRLDLLLGDFTMQKPDLPESSPEQQAEQEKIRAEIEAIQPRYSELIGFLFSRSDVPKEEHKKLESEFQILSQKMQELRSKLPLEYEQHGWVWLCLRKAPDAES